MARAILCVVTEFYMHGTSDFAIIKKQSQTNWWVQEERGVAGVIAVQMGKLLLWAGYVQRICPVTAHGGIYRCLTFFLESESWNQKQ